MSQNEVEHSTFSLKDALNKILLPKIDVEGDNLIVKCASCNPVTKADIVNLYRNLEKRLESTQYGQIDLNREQAIDECFSGILKRRDYQTNIHNLP